MSILATAMLAQGGGGDELSRSMHDAFTANQAAFGAGEVTFRLTKGTASGLAAARAGRFEPHYEAKGRFAFKGQQACHERVFAEADVLSTNKSVGNGQTMTLLNSFRMATDGKTTLVDWINAHPGRKPAHSVRLDPGSEPFDAEFQFPIALARANSNWGSPRVSLRAAFERRPHVKVTDIDRDAEFEGRRVVKITVEYETGAAEYWMDLERGAIPLKIVVRNFPEGEFPGSVRTTFHDDLRHFEGAGWLPFEQSWWTDRDGEGGKIVIQDARFAEPPPSAFTLEFAEPIVLVDQSKGLSYSARTSWDVSKLPTPGSRGVGKMERPRPGPENLPVLPGEREAGGGPGLLVLGVLTLAAAAGLTFWTRTRRGAE